MKNIAVISFTKNGTELSTKIIDYFEKNGVNIKGYAPEKYILSNIFPIPANKSGFIGKLFNECDSLVFIGAVGIAVRLIAPFLKSKTTDPAVVVIDEHGKYAISLLSSHIGGGCELTKLLGDITGATPIITTSTDINNVFAIDSWATKNDFIILNPENIKMISSSLLDKENVGFYSYFPIKGNLPKNIKKTNNFEKGKNGVIISPFTNINCFDNALNIVPKCIHIGIGAKKNTDPIKLQNFFQQILNENFIDIKSIKSISSIDLKKDEKAIVNLSKIYDLDFKTYNSEQLSNAKGKFTTSEFVLKTTGVDNVCERSAYISSNGGDFVIRKTSFEGMTIAIACENIEIDMN